ncbi:TraB/GumN family protein [Gracilibacillus orientalis]|nr:TraB/GumN family protein [Gracilibacillus orientalis]
MIKVASLLSFTLLLISCSQEETINFEDANLEAAIESELGESFTEEEVEEITALNLADDNISDLEGLQHFSSLETVSLQDNQVKDFSELQELEQLESVNVVGNPLEESQEQLDQLSEKGINVIQSVGRSDGPGGFLWKVEDENTEVYLQGTIHAGVEDFYPLHEEIEKAYLKADVVVPEVDITNVDQSEMQQINMELGTYQDGSTVKDHISEDVFSELEDTLSQFGIPLEAVEMYKPWLLANTVQQLMTQQLGYTSGVDQYFLNKASEDGKEVIDLETAEEQLEIFADTSEEYQESMLESSLMNVLAFEQQMQELFETYEQGDEDKLLEVLSEEEIGSSEKKEENEAFLQAINGDRNHNMADQIIRFLEEDEADTYFVMVGSLHLLEDPHIRSILEEEGYQAERIH